MKTFFALEAILLMFCWQAGAQIYDTNGGYVQTFAGSGFYGYIDGVGQQTMFNAPGALVADSQSNLFVWDSGNNRIRKITPNATVSTFVGGGAQIVGTGTNVSLATGMLNGMTIDRSNTIWMIAYSPAYLYKITSDATVTFTYLPALSSPAGICADSSGSIYISDGNQNKIFRYANGALSVFAGSGNPGNADGNGFFTSFLYPQALAVDQANNLYVWDSGNQLIRKIDQNQNVTTFAGQPQNVYWDADGTGTNAAITSVSQMCSDNFGNLYLTSGRSYGESWIRKISATTNVVTLAGSFTQTGYTNGAGSLARFNGANGICLAGGTIYVADSLNQRIRNITNNPQPQTVSGANLAIGSFAGVTITGVVGRTYQIQSSANMASWSNVASVLLTSSPYLWIDQTPATGNKFYRALLLP